MEAVIRQITRAPALAGVRPIPASVTTSRERPFARWSRWVAPVLLAIAVIICADASANESVVVKVTGLDDDMHKNVLRFLSIEGLAKDSERKPLTELLDGDKTDEDKASEVSADRIRLAHRRAPDQIRQALQPFGYYQPDINASLTRKDDSWQALYQVDPGIATTLATAMQVEIVGAGQNAPALIEALEKIRNSPLSRAGAVLNHAHYQSAKTTLIDLAFNNGFIDAKYIESVIRVDRQRHSAQTILRLQSGPRYVFGQITIDQTALRPEIVDNAVAIKPGDAFDTRRLNDLQIALEGTGYFDSVQVTPDVGNAIDGMVPVTVKTRLQKPRHYSAAFGFGTDTGPRVKLSADFRRINDRGHKIKADARASALGFAVSGQYEVPSWRRKDERWVYHLNSINDDIVDQDTRQYSLGASRFDAWRGFARQLYSTLSRERFDIGSTSAESTLLIVGASLRRSSTDDPLSVRQGYSMHLDLHGGHDSLGSDTTFTQTTFALRGVYTVATKTRLLGHFAYGATTADNFDLLPLGQRFFAGGDRSVRGYKFQSLTPRDADGNALGGRYQIAAGVELERMVHGNFGVAGFVDTGNASNDTLPELKTGVGVGLRYRAPIGMVRVDVAQPLDDEVNDYRLHISIGGDL